MASGWRGVAAGALALVALETLVQPEAAGKVGGLFALPGKWASNFLDPSIPTFHVGAKTKAATTSPSSSTGGSSSGSSSSTGEGNQVGTTNTGQPIYLT